VPSCMCVRVRVRALRGAVRVVGGGGPACLSRQSPDLTPLTPIRRWLVDARVDAVLTPAL
jgi:hypothetical protein